MLPFTFLIFPGSQKASMTRLPWYDVVLFVSTAAASLYLMLNIREAAELGWEFGDPPQSIIWAGYVMWAVLMEALRRTGGWSLMLCVLPFTVYPLFAGADWLGPLRGDQSTLDQTICLPRAFDREPARHSYPGLRRCRDRLPGVRHRPDDDGRWQVLHQSRLRALRHLPGRRRQGRHLRIAACSA